MSSQYLDLLKEMLLRRKMTRVSVASLAKKIGYSRYTIMKLEQAKRNPRLKTFIDWVEGLGGRIVVEWDNEKSPKD